MNANDSSGAPHHMVAIPAGKTVRDLLPQFSDVKHEVGPIGKPCALCAGCGRPFTAARKPRLTLKLYPIHCPVPVALLYRICGRCAIQYRAGGEERNRILAAVERFVLGDGAAA